MRNLVLAAFVSLVVLPAYGGGEAARPAVTLTGPNVKEFPYQHIPFHSSVGRVVEGTRQPDGTCVFSSDMTVSPGQLQSSEKMFRLQRAVDMVACKESIEEGPVDKSFNMETSAVSPEVDQHNSFISIDGHLHIDDAQRRQTSPA